MARGIRNRPQFSLGAMRHRVTLESVARVKGDGGEWTETYSTIATVWASVTPKRLAPNFRGDRLEFPTTHLIVINYSSAYMDARRITLGSRIFVVQSAINSDEINQYIEFECIEGGAK